MTFLYEGYTMLPVIDSFKQKHAIERLVVVADAGLMSEDNMNELTEKGYEFILDAKIKSASAVTEQILSLNLKYGESAVIEKDISQLKDGETNIVKENPHQLFAGKS